jgi:hypothetical protein
MIQRSRYLNALQVALDRSPVTALIGPRQSGKTTLARMVSENRPVTFFDLESPTDRQRLQNPELALEPLDGWIVLDEIQELPGLFAVLRVLADRPANRAGTDPAGGRDAGRAGGVRRARRIRSGRDGR